MASMHVRISQESRDEQLRGIIADLESQVADLESQVADLSRGGVHWWHKMRALANLLGCNKLSDVYGAVSALLESVHTRCECHQFYGDGCSQVLAMRGCE